jgi:plasmid stabilization system protein ParE
MIKEVISSIRAENDYERILNYLNAEWGKQVANNFSKRLEIVTKLLANEANIYPFVHQKRNVQQCIVTKHNILYFRQHKTKIEIISIFDTRQNPKKLRNILIK